MTLLLSASPMGMSDTINVSSGSDGPPIVQAILDWHEAG